MPKFSIVRSLVLVAVLFSYNAIGQNAPKTLRIKAKEIYEVGPTNSLILDTLIMEDKATLRFSPLGQGVLVVKSARLGKDCLISSMGNTAAFHGQNGGHLYITMHFDQLTSLTIDARGGEGQRGKNGRDGRDGIPEQVTRSTSYNSKGQPVMTMNVVPAVAAIPPTPDTAGGHAGNGGDIHLTYGSTDFIINFNHAKSRNSIVFKNSAGLPGQPGKDGRAGRSYDKNDIKTFDKGNPNDKMVKGTDGKISLVKIEDAVANPQ